MEDNLYRSGVMIGFTRDADESMPAIVSSELQKFGETFDAEEGFPCGTIFPALNKPFLAGGISK